MSAPSKAGIYKLDNPARVKTSRQPGTELLGILVRPWHSGHLGILVPWHSGQTIF